MSRPAPIHLCFYSTRCEWSKKFIEAIRLTKYVNDFKFVCVDPSPTRPALPNWLKQTPTLVIQGEKEPRINNDVMNWIYEQKTLENGNTPSNELESFLDMKMGGQFGDSYSFIDEKNSESMMMHNFTYLNGRESDGTRESFKGQQPSKKVSPKEELFNSQLEQYKASRDLGIAQPIMRQM